MTIAAEGQLISSECKAFIDGLKKADVVALDTETTGLGVSSGRDYLQGFSLAYEVGGMRYSEYFPVRHATGNLDRGIINEVYNILCEKTLIFHNRKFDLHSLGSVGLDLVDCYAYDTMLLAQMVNEERPYQKTLEACGQMYLKRGKVQKDEVDTFTKAFGWDALTPELITPYAKGDAEITLALYLKLRILFDKEYGADATALWDNELKMQTILYKMEARGIRIDTKFCSLMAGIAKLEMNDIIDDLGFEPSKTTQLSKFLFDELKLPVLATTPAGKPSLAKDVMEEYDRLLEQVDDDRARQVLNFRGWQKAASAFYVPIPKLVDSNSRVHPSFHQHRTLTGRLSCSDPNFQQIPRESKSRWSGKAKEMFLPTEGYTLISLDYSQLELRLAAAYGNEELLMEEFSKDDADPFTALSEEIGVVRFVAKTLTYGLLYGAGKGKAAKILGMSLSEVEGPYNRFLKSIPGIIKVKQICEAKARQRGYIKYWTGRKRHFTNRDDAYKSFNSLLQGGAAEVVKRVMIELDETVCNDECVMLLQIHDEIVFEIKTEKVDEYLPRIIEIMENLPTEQFGVRFKVGQK